MPPFFQAAHWIPNGTENRDPTGPNRLLDSSPTKRDGKQWPNQPPFLGAMLVLGRVSTLG